MSEEQTTELATVQRNDSGVVLAADFGDDTTGFENQTADDISIPFIQLLQDNSPPVKKKSDRYVPGTEPGFFFNTVTNEFFNGDDGFLFQVCHVDHAVLEWYPRDSDKGKGFVARHECDSEYVQAAYKAAGTKFGKIPVEEKGTELQESYSLWGIIPAADGDQPDFAIVSFASKKIRVYKDWNTIVSKFTVANPRTGRKQRPDRFAHLVRITSQFKTDSKGDYFNVVIKPAVKAGGDAPTLNDHLGASLQTPDTVNYQAAKAFRDMIVSGQATANMEAAEGDQSGDDDAPF